MKYWQPGALYSLAGVLFLKTGVKFSGTRVEYGEIWVKFSTTRVIFFEIREEERSFPLKAGQCQAEIYNSRLKIDNSHCIFRIMAKYQTGRARFDASKGKVYLTPLPYLKIMGVILDNTGVVWGGSNENFNYFGEKKVF